MGPMKQEIRSDASIWQLVFALTGVGCAFVAPYLPTLTGLWRLHDHQAGIVVSCLFLGSFTGTLSLRSNLRASLQRGCAASFAGMLIFAFASQRSGGFLLGSTALAIMGFGLGQLMSAMNLLVGAGDPASRSQRLAAIGAAWCIGAVLSPILTTVQISSIAPAWRIALFSPLFLLLIVQTRGRELPASRDRGTRSDERVQWSRVASHCALVFFIYGGIEASTAGWMPLFATRYGLGSIASSQWTISLFWVGLIMSRLAIARFLTARYEEALLRMAMTGAALSILALVTTHSLTAFWVACAAAGVCLGPLFPLLLSSTLHYALSARVMGVILASCGLGATVIPYLLGVISSGWSLRTAMLLPLAGLSLLLFLRWLAGFGKPFALQLRTSVTSSQNHAHLS